MAVDAIQTDLLFALTAMEADVAGALPRTAVGAVRAGAVVVARDTIPLAPIDQILAVRVLVASIAVTRVRTNMVLARASVLTRLRIAVVRLSLASFALITMVANTSWTLACPVTAVTVGCASDLINGLDDRCCHAEDEATVYANVGRTDQPCDGRRSRPFVCV